MIALAIRPSDWNFPLLLHVGGAMVAVGTLITVAGVLLLAMRGREPVEVAGLTRFGFRTLLYVGIPSYLVMRLAAEWIASKEGYGGSSSNDPTWLGVGYITADGSFVLIVISTILAGLAARRLRRNPASTTRLGSVAAVLIGLIVIILTVAVWAMTTKPS
jgi:hypothetical protein